MTTIAIHQPNYLPYLGFFEKMKKCDIFAILDDAEFTRDEFFQRNKIRTSLDTPKSVGWIWLTVPVEKKHVPCNQVRIKNNTKWSANHWQQISVNYFKSPFFHKYGKEFERIYNKTYEKAIDLNMDLINLLRLCFGITTKMMYSSMLRISSTGVQRLLSIVKALHGDTYFSGIGGRKYLDVSLFEKQGIRVIFQDFKHPIYKQRYSGFIPNMSSIDYLFNVGCELCL